MEVVAQMLHFIGELPGGFHILITGKAIALGLVLFLLVFAIERFHGTRTDYYRSKHFVHDIAYWFYYRSGAHHLLFLVLVLHFIGPSVAVFEIHLLTDLPYFWQLVAWLVIADFCNYWIHRMQHGIPVVWAFHSTHHSQPHLNFASTTRFHPLDKLFYQVLTLIPIAIMGVTPLTFVPVWFVLEFVNNIQHTQIPWRYGWLHRVIVSPVFHSYHHSIDPSHHDKNFAGLFSFWDYLFGTAVEDPKLPSAYGLADIKPTTFMSTLYAPFQVIYRRYSNRNAHTAET